MADWRILATTRQRDFHSDTHAGQLGREDPAGIRPPSPCRKTGLLSPHFPRISRACVRASPRAFAVLRGKPATWGVLGNPRRAAEIILATKNASKVNFGYSAFLLVFYKSGFTFSRPKPAWAMAGAGQQMAVGDSTGGPQATKPIFSG